MIHSVALFSIGFVKNNLGNVFAKKVVKPIVMEGMWSYTHLLEEAHNKNLEKVIVTGNSVLSKTLEGDVFKTDIIPFQIPSVIDKLVTDGVDLSMNMQVDNFWSGLGGILPWLLILGIYIGISSGTLRGNMMANKETKQVGEIPDTTFDDVAGCDESKFELQEIVDFLKDPQKYTSVGAKIPKGVIMEGPPGTGKTLLARAVAAEAKVPFFSISASQFVEMYVGLGAARVRSLFKNAKEQTPSIIFIDEIDAIGKKRSTSQGGVSVNEEREQTLNQILSEMDGFEKESSVIVLAATNRVDTLDDALLRPGRFDRKVPVGLPNAEERVAILNVHAQNKPIGSSVDFEEITKDLTGFSGAEISNLLNEASISAARRSSQTIEALDIEESIEKVTIGFKKPTKMSLKKKRLVAYHEAGHAIVAKMLTDFEDEVSKVTIIPRSNGAGGFTKFLPSEDSLIGLNSKSYLVSQIAVLLGGRVAEQLVFGEEYVTTGASSDIARASDLAYNMISKLGYGSTRIVRGEDDILKESQQLVDDAESVAIEILSKNRILLDTFSENLIAKETIDRETIEKIFSSYM